MITFYLINDKMPQDLLRTSITLEKKHENQI